MLCWYGEAPAAVTRVQAQRSSAAASAKHASGPSCAQPQACKEFDNQQRCSMRNSQYPHMALEWPNSILQFICCAWRQCHCELWVVSNSRWMRTSKFLTALRGARTASAHQSGEGAAPDRNFQMPSLPSSFLFACTGAIPADRQFDLTELHSARSMQSHAAILAHHAQSNATVQPLFTNDMSVLQCYTDLLGLLAPPATALCAAGRQRSAILEV